MRTPEEHAVGAAIIHLMRGVVYRESNEDAWATLERQGATVRDHFGTIGVELVVDDTEGYAYLRSEEEDPGAAPLPRLVMRRSLTYNVSLLLVLLRKRLVEFETTSSEGKLVLERDQIIEMLRLFFPDSTNEARVIDTADSTIRKAEELGFLRALRPQGGQAGQGGQSGAAGRTGQWEVRRIIKAYVDAQVLSDFAAKLEEYAAAASTASDDD